MGLAARARRLALARGLSGMRGGPSVGGLNWSEPEPGGEIDRATVPRGSRVVADHTVLVYREEGSFSQSVYRERLAVDEEDRGRVFAWNGQVVGRVLTRGEGVLLDITWPEGLPARDPDAPLDPSGVVGDSERDAIERRRLDDATRAAEDVAEAERASRRR